ncbi:MAG: GerMN domain-containing protein [Cyanobacteria bacterium J06600_6]
MQDRNKNRFSLTAIAAITGLILAAGGGVAWWTKSNLEETAKVVQPNPSPIEQADPVSPIPDPITQEKVVSVSWLNPTGDTIKLVSNPMTFAKSIKPEQVLKTAIETLLSQPPEGAEYTTAIPKDTKLLSLDLKESGIHINLSKEFIAGGGSASMSSRLAQIIYTASSSSDREPIWISVEGKALENLGEEGIVVNQPMTKKDFKDNFEGFDLDKSTS